MIEYKEEEDKCVIVSVATSYVTDTMMKEYLDELSFLILTVGARSVKSFTQRLPIADSKTYVGMGKLLEVKEYIKENEIEWVVFDDELSPSQLRNIERELGCNILDRTQLILSIFAKRASTAHAKIQVELAEYQYMLPRLSRMWTHLDKQKTLQRKNRESLVRVALVGYTNVGKSTLMNCLSKSDVFAENKLFATLDTTVRKVVIDNLPFLLTDTVGFIRKLPKTLMESFKSTLDEVTSADLLVHVVDISHPNFEQQIDVVNSTLNEIGASDKETIIIFNKIDNYSYIKKDEDDLTPKEKENYSLEELKNTWMAKNNLTSIFISAKDKTNFTQMKQVLYDR